MNKKISFDLYLRVLSAFFISFLIFYFIVGLPYSNFSLFYLFFLIPAVIISAVCVITLIVFCKKFVNKKRINFLCIAIVVIIIVLALMTNILYSSKNLPPTKLIGTWYLDDGQEPLISYVEERPDLSNETIDRMYIVHSGTHGWNSIDFYDSYDTNLRFDFDSSSNTMTIYDSSSYYKYNLILKIDISEINDTSVMTTHYISHSGTNLSFNVTDLDGKIWIKTN